MAVLRGSAWADDNGDVILEVVWVEGDSKKAGRFTLPASFALGLSEKLRGAAEIGERIAASTVNPARDSSLPLPSPR